MTVHEFSEEFGGLPVFTFPEPADAPTALPAAGAVAWRLAFDPYDDGGFDSFDELWQRFTSTVDLSGVRALVIGQWGEVYDESSAIVVSAVVAAKDRLTSLRAVFLGDIAQEQSEISWIQQSDVSPLLTAFPALEVLTVRGGSELEFPAVRHASLRELRFESGGLPADAVRGICASDFPALESLVLGWACRSTAVTTRSTTWPECCPAPASPDCATWACRTARYRTRSPPPSPRLRSWRAWRAWTCRWAR